MPTLRWIGKEAVVKHPARFACHDRSFPDDFLKSTGKVVAICDHLANFASWFYRDFIALLYDGRVLVVEYKGKVWSEIEDSAEKRAVGAVWESRSDGKCLFLMPNGPDLAAIEMKIRQR